MVNPKDSFGLEVVGAGVETAVAARTLSGLGCHRAQGLLIAPPLSRDEI
ncbi:EAL domain-containing protein [Nocardia fusca]|nr:EAL domain-containing protein [Nocardia fusca]